MNKIVEVEIVPPKGFGDHAVVLVAYDHFPEVMEKLFSFFDDEISFSKRELIGLTADEASQLYHQKDVAYLRSG